MWTIRFWLDVAERAVKTFAQVLLAALGTGAAGLHEVAWGGVLSIAGLAVVVSVLTSVGSGLLPTDRVPTPSLVPVIPEQRRHSADVPTPINKPPTSPRSTA